MINTRMKISVKYVCNVERSVPTYYPFVISAIDPLRFKCLWVTMASLRTM